MARAHLTVLGHTDLISEFTGDLRYLTVPQPDAQITMVGLKAVRPAVVFASLCPYRFREPAERPLTSSETWQQWLSFRKIIEASPSFRVILASDAINPAEDERVQLLLHLEGAHPIEEPSGLEQFAAFGGRSLTLTWNTANQYAGGTSSDSGLTELGKEFLHELERLGILLDLSHLNEKSFWEVLEIFRGPVMASHSNSRELVDSPRNLTKRQLHTLRERQAWVGVSFARSHLTTHSQSTVDDVMLHLEALREELGTELVGIGTDFDGILSSLPDRLATISQLPNLWEGLAAVGWDEEEIRAVQGQNFLDFWHRSVKSS